MDSELFNAWETVLDDIENNSPYHAKFVDTGVELCLDGGDDVPSGIVGILHTPEEWERITYDVQRFGIWPARISS